MPKIDTATIDGFEAMDDSQKLAALLELEIPERVDLGKFVSKAQYDKTASELAEAKRINKSKLTEEEAAKAEQEQKNKELQEKYDALLEESTIAKYKTKYMGQGYDEKLAEETAEALFNGETDKVFANGEKFRAAVEQKTKAEMFKEIPRPGGSGGEGSEQKSIDIQLAERIGKARADSMKSANNTLSKYTGGN